MKAFRGEILSVPDDPAVAGADAIRHFEDGLLVVEDGLVALLRALCRSDKFAEAETEPLDGLIVPGFVDAHVHYPQIERIASHGEQLMQWLERHIFPAEKAFADRGPCRRGRRLLPRRAAPPRHHQRARLRHRPCRLGRRAVRSRARARHADRLRQGADGPGAGGPARHDRLRPRRHRGADRPMARPRPPRLCGHAALRAHLQRRAARRCRRAGRRASRTC